MNKLLEVSDISKRFGGVTAIRNLTFSLEKGEIKAEFSIKGKISRD
jgi:ABC-type branched-subunit amino acid transport system ATPase component